jgi:DNA-binding transcriptional MerR regulator
MPELLTGPEAAELCGVDPSTIRQWKRRGLIKPDGLDDHGRPLYAQLTIARAEARTRHRAKRTPGQPAA